MFFIYIRGIKEQERLAKDSSAPDVIFKSLLYRPEKLHRIASPISHFSFIPVGISRYHTIFFFFHPSPHSIPFFRALSSFPGSFALCFFVCLFVFPFDASQCVFNHSRDYFYLSGTGVKTLSFSPPKLPPRRLSHIQPLLIPRFKDNPNFESGFTSRSLPLITNCFVILSAIFHPSPIFFSLLPQSLFQSTFLMAEGGSGAGPLPVQGSGFGAAAAGAARGIPNHPSAFSFLPWTSLSGPYSLQGLFFWTEKSSPAADGMDSTHRFFLPAQSNLSQQVSAFNSWIVISERPLESHWTVTSGFILSADTFTLP